MCGEKVDIEIAKGPGNKARDRRGDGRPVVRDSRREREASRRSRSYDRRSRSRDRRVKNCLKTNIKTMIVWKYIWLSNVKSFDYKKTSSDDLIPALDRPLVEATVSRETRSRSKSPIFRLAAGKEVYKNLIKIIKNPARGVWKKESLTPLMFHQELVKHTRPMIESR